MQHLLPTPSHPFKRLLHLEWILFGLIVILSTMTPPMSVGQQSPVVTIPLLVCFGWLGLKLPIKQPWPQKVVFMVISLGLIGIGTLKAVPGKLAITYIIWVMRGCLLFLWPGQIIVALTAWGLVVFSMYRQFQSRDMPLIEGRQEFMIGGFAVIFALSLIFVLMMLNTLVAERQSRDQLALAHQQLRTYSLRIEDQAILQERNRIARDIHDSLGHSLTGLNLQMEAVIKLWDIDPARARILLVGAKQLGTRALQDVRQSVSTLHRKPTPQRPLDIDIQSLISQVQQGADLKFQTHLNIEEQISQEIHLAIYRIVQEALTNICKHADATEVMVSLTTTPQQLQLEIKDNGCGFCIDQMTTGFGLQSMQERSQTLGGEYFIQSQPGSGCQIRVTIPVPVVHV